MSFNNILMFVIGILISSGLGLLLARAFPYCTLRRDWSPPVPSVSSFTEAIRSAESLTQAEEITKLYSELIEISLSYSACASTLKSKFYYLAFIPPVFFVAFLFQSSNLLYSILFMLPLLSVFLYEKLYIKKAVLIETETSFSAGRNSFASSSDFMNYWSEICGLLSPLVNPRFSFSHKTIPDCNTYFAIEYILFLILTLDSVFHVF